MPRRHEKSSKIEDEVDVESKEIASDIQASETDFAVPQITRSLGVRLKIVFLATRPL